jgi:hypothetical protein
MKNIDEFEQKDKIYYIGFSYGEKVYHDCELLENIKFPLQYPENTIEGYRWYNGLIDGYRSASDSDIRLQIY